MKSRKGTPGGGDGDGGRGEGGPSRRRSRNRSSAGSPPDVELCAISTLATAEAAG